MVSKVSRYFCRVITSLSVSASISVGRLKVVKSTVIGLSISGANVM